MTYKIDYNSYNTALRAVAKILIARDSNISYTQTNDSHAAAKTLVNQFGLSSRAYLAQLYIISDKMDKNLRKQYKVRMPTGLAAIEADFEQLLAKVPQIDKVVFGLQDTILGVINTETGRVKHINL
jgi:hypothetical protein